MMQNRKLIINLLDHQVILAVRISQINENAISNSLCKHLPSMSHHKERKKRHQGAIRSPFNFTKNTKPLIADFQKNWSISVNEFQ